MIINREKLEELDACKEAIVFFSSKYDQIEEVALLRDVLQYEDEVKREYGKDIYEWCYWLIAYILEPIDRVRFSVYTAELVLHIYEEQYPGDMRPRKTIDSVKTWIENPTEDHRKAAKEAKEAARNAAKEAADTAAWAAADTAWAAADTAAWAAKEADAAEDAYTADDAYEAAKAAAKADPSTKDKILVYGIELLKE